MIRVSRPQEPATFDTECRKPGLAWLADLDHNPRHRPLWREFTAQLREAYGRRCGFLAMYIANGTIDHWVSLRTDRSLAYEWGNFRFVDGQVNSAKKPSWEGQLLDPYEVQDDWFELHLPSLQLLVSPHLAGIARERAEFTLRKLRLDHGEDIIRLRREWLQMYEEHKIALEGLDDKAPLLARAIRKRDAVKHNEGLGGSIAGT